MFLEGIKATLTTDVAFKDGFYESPPTAGLKALGRVWAGWAMSQPFYFEEVIFCYTASCCLMSRMRVLKCHKRVYPAAKVACAE